MTKYHIMLLASIVLTSVCLIFFKIISVGSHGEIRRIINDPRLYWAILAYCAAFMMWIIAASKIDYTVLVFSNTLGLVLSGLIGWYLFNESITSVRLVSYLLICSGVLLLMASNGR